MIKNSMDILDIMAITRRYNELIKGCFIDNIYYSGSYWFFKIRCRSDKHYLKIEPGVRFHISRVEPVEKKIDKYTLFLRKHIRDRKINSVKQLGWERIITIDVRDKNSLKLIIEIIPRGFFVILDENDNILYADKFAELRDRVIKRGVKYTPPPGFNDFENYVSSLRNRISLGKDLIRGIVRGWGLPGYIAEEILYRSGLYGRRLEDASKLTDSTIEILIDNYMGILKEVENYKGYVISVNNRVDLYTCYKPLIYYELYDADVKEYDNLDDAIDSYFTLYERVKAKMIEEEKLSRELDALEKNIERQRRVIEDLIKEMELYNKYYELLVNNYLTIEEILNCAKETRESYGWEYIIDKCTGIVKTVKEKGLIYIKLDDFEIPLDIRKDTWSNILSYKIKVGEINSSIEKIKNYIDELVKKRDEVLTMKQSINTVDNVILRPRYWFERFHWLITTNGFLAVGGRNADQNEFLVKKHLAPNDIFLHADIYGAPATILKTMNRNVDEQDILDAGVIAGCYSRAWREGFGYVDVYWVKGYQVSKKPPSGEYLGKGAFMIYGERNYLRVKMEIAIGIEEVCDPLYGLYRRVIAGPEYIVRERSIVYAVLQPGDVEPGVLSSKLYSLFMDRSNSKNLGVTRDDILQRIPGPSYLKTVEKGLGRVHSEC